MSITLAVYNGRVRGRNGSLIVKSFFDFRLSFMPTGSSAKHRDLAQIKEDIEAFKQTDLFIYNPDRGTHGAGALAHKHVIDATAWLLQNRPTLQAILMDRYPIVLIDESPDTMKSMLGALMNLAKPMVSGLTLGLLGDHRQRIYTDGHADLPSLVPPSWATPELQMNHRSQRRIVTLINKIWEANLEGERSPPTAWNNTHELRRTVG